MAKPKVIICGKLLLGDAIFLFLDSLDHEVKKQNVMYCCRLYCTIAKLVCMDRMTEFLRRGFVQLCSQFAKR